MRGVFEEIPFWKIVGLPWKEGEIRLGVDKKVFISRTRFTCEGLEAYRRSISFLPEIPSTFLRLWRCRLHHLTPDYSWPPDSTGHWDWSVLPIFAANLEQGSDSKKLIDPLTIMQARITTSYQIVIQSSIVKYNSMIFIHCKYNSVIILCAGQLGALVKYTSKLEGNNLVSNWTNLHRVSNNNCFS